MGLFVHIVEVKLLMAYTRRHNNLYRIFFSDFSVNS